MASLTPTQVEISRAALAWCGEKDRETGMSDVRYFEGNWRYLPGLELYVMREIAKRPDDGLIYQREAGQ